jgi:hypothetical protein
MILRRAPQHAVGYARAMPLMAKANQNRSLEVDVCVCVCVLSVVCGVCGVWCVACKGYVGCDHSHSPVHRHAELSITPPAAIHTTQSAVRSHAKVHNINCKVAEGQCVHAELCGCTTEAEGTSTSTVMVDSAWWSLAVWCKQWSESDGGLASSNTTSASEPLWRWATVERWPVGGVRWGLGR